MAIEYGATGDGRNLSKTYERLAVADNTGAVAEHILRYTREEETLENVLADFGAGLLEGNEVINATVTSTVDESIIEASTSNAAPQLVRFYNPRQEASVTFLGTTPAGSTFTFDGQAYDTQSSELSETLGDVKRVTVRGVAFGVANGCTVGDATGGGTIRVEKRYSNTDYVRQATTTVSFS